MTVATSVTLSDCPAALQSVVREKQSEAGSEILSITRTESTPFKDKSIVSSQYRVIMNRLNLITVLHCQADGALKDKVFVNSLIWGDILEIIRTVPEGSSLAERKNPQRIFLLLSLQYDDLCKPLPDPVWWLAGYPPALTRFSVGFAACLLQLMADMEKTKKEDDLGEIMDHSSQ